MSLLLLNSMAMAVACSAYHGFCGNGAVLQLSEGMGVLKSAVCVTWLHPLPTAQYPKLAAWMIHGGSQGLRYRVTGLGS